MRVNGTTHEQSDTHLKKQIGLFGLIILAVSVQIGPGQPQATLGSAGIARPSSIITWILGAVFFGIVGAAWMEPGTMFPRSGPGMRLPRLTHGGFLSWFNGWGCLLAALSLPVIEVQAVITYVGVTRPSWPAHELLGYLEGYPGTSWQQR